MQAENLDMFLSLHDLHRTVSIIEVHRVPRMNGSAIHEIFDKCINIDYYTYLGTAIGGGTLKILKAPISKFWYSELAAQS